MRWIVIALMLVSSQAFADDGRWSATADGNWSDTSKWESSNIATGYASTAWFTNGQTAVRTVTLDIPMEIGRLAFTNLFTVTGGVINAAAGSFTNYVPVTGSATISTGTLYSVISNASQVCKLGSGVLRLWGDNTYTGKTIIINGFLDVDHFADAGVASPLGAYPSAGAGGLTCGNLTTFTYSGPSVKTDRGFTTTASANTTFRITNPVDLELGACSIGGSAFNLGGSGYLHLQDLTFSGTLTLNSHMSCTNLTATSGFTKAGSSNLVVYGNINMQAAYSSSAGNVILGAPATVTIGNATAFGMGSASASTNDFTYATSALFSNTTFQVGADASSQNSWLKLGSNTTIRATTYAAVQQGTSGATMDHKMTVGTNGTLTINTPIIYCGNSKNNVGRIILYPNSVLTIRGVTAGVLPSISVGQHSADTATTNARQTLGVLDASQGMVDIQASVIVCGYQSMAGNVNTTGRGEITLSSSNNVMVVTNSGSQACIYVGFETQTTATSQTLGFLTISGMDAASRIINTNAGTAIFLGASSGANNNAKGTFNMLGGTLPIGTTGPGIRGGSEAYLNLANCEVQALAASSSFITNITVATITNSVTLNDNGYNIGIPQSFQGTGVVTKAGAGTITLGGTNLFLGTLAASAGALSFSSPVTVTNLATVTMAASTTLNLNYTGTQSVYAVTLNGVPMAAGTYGAETTGITGTGYITSANQATGGTTAPEPDTYYDSVLNYLSGEM